ncbi:MAG: FecR domain-containing protein, partial [Candidatus Acidiferrales bacterium]
MRNAMQGAVQGKVRSTIQKKSSKLTSLLILSTLLLLTATSAAAQNKKKVQTEPEIVRISAMQGDVRLSRGEKQHADLNKPWEQAETNLPMEAGFSLATGAGRAEIELENGSMIYLADNSLLTFEWLDDNDGIPETSVLLSTGTMTLYFDPAPKETLFVHTPQDELTFRKESYLRVDSFLDATSVTPLLENGEDVVRGGQRTIRLANGQIITIMSGQQTMHLAKGQTITTQNGRILSAPGSTTGTATLDLGGLVPLINSLTGLSEADRKKLLATVTATLSSKEAHAINVQNTSPNQPVPSPAPADWDSWVDSRLKTREAETAAALKVTGLTQFVPGLTDLYEQGVFFPCEGYGQCWEPKDQHDADAIDDTGPAEDLDAVEMRNVSEPLGHALERGQATSQAPGQAQQNQVVQPKSQTNGQINQQSNLPPNLRVEYVPVLDCSNRVQRITYAIDPVTRKKREIMREDVLSGPSGRTWPWAYCYSGDFVQRHGRYVFVARRAHHHPPVHCVKIGKRICYVPRHPSDTKGKPPVNLKHGVLQPTQKNGGTVTRVAFNPSVKYKVLPQTPKGLQGQPFRDLHPAERPEITVHFRADNLPKTGTVAKGIEPGILHGAQAPKIQYDYKSHQFMQPGHQVAGHTTPPIPVGAMNPRGGIVPGTVRNPSTGVRTDGGFSGGGSAGSHGSGGGVSG